MCLIRKKRHRNGVWELITTKPHKCILQTSYFPFNCSQNTAILLHDFFSYPSFFTPTFTNYAIAFFTIIPKYHFRKHAHTPTGSSLQYTSPHLKPLYIILPFTKPCFSLSEKLTKIFCGFRLTCNVNTGKKCNQAAPGTLPMPEQCTYYSPVGSVCISLLSYCVFSPYILQSFPPFPH